MTLLIAVVLIAICGGIGWASSRNTGDAAPARATTCEEWTAKGGTNKVIQAREMLTSLRAVDGLGAPETQLAQRFADGITNVCSAKPGWSLSEVASGLYLTEKPTFG